MEKLITQFTNLTVCKPFIQGVCDLVLRKRDLQRMSKAIVLGGENINVMCNGNSGASEHSTCAYRILLHCKVPLLPTFGPPPCLVNIPPCTSHMDIELGQSNRKFKQTLVDYFIPSLDLVLN